MHSIESPFLDMEKITDSGQIFRLRRIGEKGFVLVAKNRVLRIKVQDPDRGAYRLDCLKEEFSSLWQSYFDLDTDYEAFENSIPSEDIFLRSAAAYGRGIRILRQDPWEVLVSFIISQRKTIPSIRSSIEKLSRLLGKPLGEGHYAFPTPREVVWGGLSALRECSLGYRAPYIYETARMTLEGENLRDYHDLGDEELLSRLMRFAGVGKKVAGCVALFAYHRLGIFPVDVWMEKIIREEYGGSFPLERYRGFAGVLQQYMFFYARERAGRTSAGKGGAGRETSEGSGGTNRRNTGRSPGRKEKP